MDDSALVVLTIFTSVAFCVAVVGFFLALKGIKGFTINVCVEKPKTTAEEITKENEDLTNLINEVRLQQEKVNNKQTSDMDAAIKGLQEFMTGNGGS